MHEIDRVIHAIELIDKPNHITVLTGAGVSAESGIPTFRGPGGLWRNYQPEDLATPEAFARDPRLVWEWYEWRRDIIRKALPNDAHTAIAELEATLAGGASFTLITQNVDGLHLRAGSKSVIELHGNIFRARCTREGGRCALPEPQVSLPPHCTCGAMLRPDIVWFGEPVDLIGEAAAASSRSDVMIVIGTSAAVYPAAGLVSLVRGTTIEINPDPTPITEQFTFSIRSSACAATRLVLEAIARRTC